MVSSLHAEELQYGVWPVSSMVAVVPGTTASSLTPAESVSHSVTWRRPGPLYTWVGAAPDPELPSPKVQL
jgi:hypothetical protein